MIKTYTAVAIITIIVLLAVVHGFTRAGLPNQTREANFDQTRVSRIRNVVSVISNYYFKNNVLPQKLSDLSDILYAPDDIKDPQTGKEFNFELTSQTSYKICADFAVDSKDIKDTKYYYSDKKYEHPKGNYCFSENVVPNYPQPTPTNIPPPTPLENKNSNTCVKDNSCKSRTPGSSFRCDQNKMYSESGINQCECTVNCEVVVR